MKNSELGDAENSPAPEPTPENELIGFEEEYSDLSTSQIKTVILEKKKARKKESSEYKNTVKPRRKTRTAVLVLGAAALLVGVTFATINMSETPEPSNVTAGEESAIIFDSEEKAKEKALFMLNDVGGSFHYQITSKYGEEGEIIDSINSTIQEDGTIVEDERGDSYVISGEISGIPSDFDVEESSAFFEEPLKDEPLWHFEELPASEEISSTIFEGDTLIKAIKFYGMNFADGTSTAVTVIYSTDSEGKIRVKIDASVLVMEEATTSPSSESGPAETKIEDETPAE